MMTAAAGWIALGAVSVCIVILIGVRLSLTSSDDNHIAPERWAFCQTTGNKEIQADCVQTYENKAGMMAVLADGIGRENTGKVAAQVAADTVIDAFQPYHVLNNPEYLFRTAFLEAHSRVQKTIGERRGGASMGAVFTNGQQLYYALAGNIKIALFRSGELIPISKGQTLSVLAKDAYQAGRLSREETIWSLETTRIWNYLGKDGFHEIEVCNPPVMLKKNDIVVLASQGIYEETSWVEIEEVLLSKLTLKDKAEQIVQVAQSRGNQDKENGSIVLLMPEVTDEKNQF